MKLAEKNNEEDDLNQRLENDFFNNTVTKKRNDLAAAANVNPYDDSKKSLPKKPKSSITDDREMSVRDNLLRQADQSYLGVGAMDGVSMAPSAITAKTGKKKKKKKKKKSPGIDEPTNGDDFDK